MVRVLSRPDPITGRRTDITKQSIGMSKKREQEKKDSNRGTKEKPSLVDVGSNPKMIGAGQDTDNAKSNEDPIDTKKLGIAGVAIAIIVLGYFLIFKR